MVIIKLSVFNNRIFQLMLIISFYIIEAFLVLIITVNIFDPVISIFSGFLIGLIFTIFILIVKLIIKRRRREKDKEELKFRKQLNYNLLIINLIKIKMQIREEKYFKLKAKLKKIEKKAKRHGFKDIREEVNYLLSEIL